MALRKCRECGSQVSSRAATCPQCGAPSKRKTNPLVGLLAFVIVIAVCAGVCTGVFNPGDKTRPGAASEDGDRAGATKESAKGEDAEPRATPRTTSVKAGTKEGASQHKTDAKRREPELTAEQSEYLVLAALYNAAVKDQGDEAPLLDVNDPKSTIGRLPGNYEVLQVIGRSSGLLNRIDQDGIPLYSIWVQNLPMERTVDGDKFSFGQDAVFSYDGTRSYTTVLGARRTVHAVSALSKEMLQWGRGYLSSQQSRWALEWVAQAKGKLDALRAELEELKSNNKELTAYEETISRIQLYEPNAKSSDGIAELLKKEQAKLKSMPKPIDEQLEAYRAKKAELQRKLRRAHNELRRVTTRAREEVSAQP